jgi:hypothetical protein
MIEQGTEFLSPEQVEEALSRLGGSVEEGIAKMSENIGAVSKAVPSWAPDRADMPVINEKDLPATSQALNKGLINWRNPYKVQERRAMTRLASTLPKGSSERRTLLAMLKSAAPIGSGKNGYIAFYKNKQVEVMADTQYEAQQIAADHFRARKPHDVTVMLAEKGGKQVTHMPLFASKKKAYGPGKKITVEDLEMIGGNALRGDEDLEDLADTLNSAYGMRGAMRAMREADEILGGFGVESVFEEGEYDGSPAMMYVNTGDTYNATIVYDVDEDELYASTWGDWVEYAERQGRRMR